jgi:hypothetical protein
MYLKYQIMRQQQNFFQLLKHSGKRDSERLFSRQYPLKIINYNRSNDFCTHFYENAQVKKQFQLINKVKTTINVICILVSNPNNLPQTRLSEARCSKADYPSLYENSFRRTKGKVRQTYLVRMT